MLFPVLANSTHPDRNHTWEKDLAGQPFAAAKGHHDGRPTRFGARMLTFAHALRDKGQPLAIAKKLKTRACKTATNPSMASVHRALAEHRAANGSGG
jgi:hypothetical protein